MNKLQKICILLLLAGLISCDDKASKSKVDTQSFPKFDSIQTNPGIDQLKAILFDNPEDFNALSSLADLYFEAARYLEAIQVYDRALAVNPMCADCFNDKGLALFYLGDTNSALAAFDQATAIEPGYTHAWLSKGYVLVSSGRYEEAIAPLNKVKELDATGALAREADKFLAQVASQNPQ